MRSMLLAMLVAAVPAAADATDAWVSWTHELHRQCPERHVDWVCDGCYDDELIAPFLSTLRQPDRRRLRRLADVRRVCAQSTVGQSCEMNAYLKAIEAETLLSRFVAQNCARLICEEPALCTVKAPVLRARTR